MEITRHLWQKQLQELVKAEVQLEWAEENVNWGNKDNSYRQLLKEVLL